MCAKPVAQLPVLVLHVAVQMHMPHVTANDDHDNPSAKKVRAYRFCDKWAKDRAWLQFRETEDAMYCTM